MFPNSNEGALYPPEAIPKKKKQLLRAWPQESGVASSTTSGPAPSDGAPPSRAKEGAPGTLLGQGSGALFWRASDLANIMREALGHHMVACFAARFP